VRGPTVSPLDLELISGGAWRAAEEGALGAWRLNAALGFSGRINSCWPLGDPGLGVDDAILAVERWYAARGLPTVFKLADGATVPEDLSLRLAAMGYRPDTETILMTGPVAGEPDGEVALSDDPDACFESVFVRAGPGGGDARERLEALARTPSPRAFACIFGKGVTAAIGACSTEAPWTGVFAMRTLPGYRRLGLARRLLAALLAAAREAGALKAWLQVETANHGAIRLYEAMGFAPAYRYRYWRRPRV
jgi:GNAT superfamily N-acetyltransferase